MVESAHTARQLRLPRKPKHRLRPKRRYLVPRSESLVFKVSFLTVATLAVAKHVQSAATTAPAFLANRLVVRRPSAVVALTLALAGLLSQLSYPRLADGSSRQNP